MSEVIRSATISVCEKYRYDLFRIWDMTTDHVTFIGLNPSTADEETDDPTIRRCIAYAKSWGYGGIRMVNLFAYRATEPKDMMGADDPIGSQNDNLLKGARTHPRSLIIAAWGNHGSFQGRDIAVRKIVGGLHYLKLNKSGQPAHPLYLRADLKPTLWSPQDV